MFCVECGREAVDTVSTTGLCRDCFLEKNRFTDLPQTIDLEVCAHCRSRRRGEQWFLPAEGGEAWEPIIVDAVEEALHVDPRVHAVTAETGVVPEDERNYHVSVHVSGAVEEDLAFTETHEARARVKNGVCVRCSRIMGNYFEATVQVRAENRALSKDELRHVRGVASEVIDRIVASGDSLAFVLKDEEIHGGLDITAGTMNAGRMIARAIAQAYGARVREHAKIVGRKDGLDVKRMTFGVRIPEYRSGDVVVHEETPFLVTGVTPKLVTLHDLATGRTRKVEHTDLARAIVLARDDARDAVVVSRAGDELQVLDPWSYATVTVRAPPDLPEGGDTVPVLRHEGELIPLVPS